MVNAPLRRASVVLRGSEEIPSTEGAGLGVGEAVAIGCGEPVGVGAGVASAMVSGSSVTGSGIIWFGCVA